MPRAARPELRLVITAFLFLCALGGIVARLYWVQVIHYQDFKERVAGRSNVTVRIPSVRGEIRDRKGIALVTNRASYEVDFYLPDMVRGYRERIRERGDMMPIVRYRGTVRGFAKDFTEPDIVQIVNGEVVPRLEELHLAKDYNAHRLQRHLRTNEQVPFTYLEDIDFPTIAKFSEHDLGLPGVDISIKPVRQYLYGALAAHLLGYVGMPEDIDKLPDVKDYNFYQADTEGKSQVELFMDKYLRGKPGKRTLMRSVKGQIEGEISREEPKPGNNVFLTIDARIQLLAEQALRAVGRAAAVVVDPNTGEILAMATVPSYDPNTFIPSISGNDWKKLREDEAVPLINRAICAFPPGSTFKICTSLSGLRKGLANAHFNCGGGVSYGEHFFHCWIAEKGGSHGTLGLPDAIKVSCNSFFYQFGNAAGIEAIDATGTTLGLGEKSGIELSDESPGVLPGPEWMKLNHPNEKWSQAYTANVSIGQGYDLVTPLQLAILTSAVANGGVSYYPRLVKKVLGPDGKPALDEDGKVAVPDTPKIRGDLRHDFTKAQIDLVRRGLWKVVNEQGGTGGKARLKSVQVAGKTGTAQAKRHGKPDTIAWFTCFAPFDEPRYVVTVMVQGGEHGGSVAAPIAAKILEDTLAMEDGTLTPELVRLEPAHHPNPFKLIPAVDFKEASPELGTADQEKLDASQDRATPQMQRVRGAPDIRADADAQGRVGQRVRPVQQPRQERQPSFLERLFGPRKPPPPQPQPRR
jgi:penicillin-binding protein 2